MLTLRFSIILLGFLISQTIIVGITNSYSQETFVYVSNGEEGNISIFELNSGTGNMKMVTKVLLNKR